MNGVPRFRATGSGRWRVEKRKQLGWVAVSPQGHAIRQPDQATAYAYALGRAHQTQILRQATPTQDARPLQRAVGAIEKAIQAHKAMDAIGGY